MDLVSSIQDQVSSAWDDFATTGAPALIAGAEQYAADQLKAQATQSKAQAQAALNEVVNRPGPSSGVMASIQGVFNDIGQNAVVKQYGIYILAGALVLLIVGKKVL